MAPIALIHRKEKETWSYMPVPAHLKDVVMREGALPKDVILDGLLGMEIIHDVGCHS